MSSEKQKQFEVQKEHVKKQLGLMADKGADRVSRHTIDQRISKEFRANEKAVANRIDNLIAEKYREGADILFQKWEIEYNKEKSDLKFRHFEDRFQAYMKAWQLRVDMALRIAASNAETPSDQYDSVVSSNEEFLRTIEFALPFLQNVSSEQMMKNAMHFYGEDGENLFQAEISRMFTESFPADHFVLLQKLYGGKEPSEQEYDFLRSELEWSFQNGAAYSKLMSKKNRSNGADFDARMTTSSMLLQSLNGSQRMKMLEGYKQVPAHLPAQIRQMVNYDYISIGHGRMLVSKQIKMLKGDKDLLKEYEELQTYLKEGKEEIFAKRKGLKEFKKKQAEWIGDMPGGHYNRVGRILTPKGMLGMYLTVNGALTMAANFGVSAITDPGSLPTNPGLWLGAGMTAAGLELSGGMGGLALRPGEIAGKILKDRNEPRRDRFTERMDGLEELYSDPEMAKFYYEFGHNIAPAYKNVRRRNQESIPLNEIVTLTKAEQAAGTKVEEKIKKMCIETGLSKEELEKKVFQWAKHMSDSVMGAGRKGWPTQKEFIEKVDDATGALAGNRSVLEAKRPSLYIGPRVGETKTETN